MNIQFSPNQLITYWQRRPSRQCKHLFPTVPVSGLWRYHMSGTSMPRALPISSFRVLPGLAKGLQDHSGSSLFSDEINVN